MSSTSGHAIQIFGDLRIRAFRVAWMCEELQLPWTLQETFPWTELMYDVNPLGKVPVIKDGDFYLYESAAILNYLAYKYQETAALQLIPKVGTKERAVYDQFLMVIFTDLESCGLWTHRKFVDLVLHSRNLKLMRELHYIHIAETAKPAKYTFDRALKTLTAQLEGNNYLLGDNFSVIDIHFLIDLEWAEALNWIKGNPQEKLLKDYYDRVRQRTAYKKCWKMRSLLDLSSKSLNTFTPANQEPPIGME